MGYAGPRGGRGSCGYIDVAPGAAIQHMVAKTRVAFLIKSICTIMYVLAHIN